MGIPNLAMVGIGGFAKLYLEFLTPMVKDGKAKLAAVVVRSPQKYAETIKNLEELGCKIFPDTKSMYQEMKNSLDVVILPTGIDTHQTYTCEALANGCNVMLEKPAAGTVAEVETMIEAEKIATNNWVMVAFQHMYCKSVRDMKKAVIDNKIGKIQAVVAMGRWPRADSYYNRNNWAGKVKTEAGAFVYDSPANNAFAHFLNMALFLAGETLENPAFPVEVTGKLLQARDIETFDSCDLEFKTTTKIAVRVLFSHTCRENCQPRVKIVGDKGTIIWQMTENFRGGYYKIYDNDNNLVEESETYPAFEQEINTVVAKAQDATVQSWSLENALAHTKAIEIIHKTLKSEKVCESNLEIINEDRQYIVKSIADEFDNIFLNWKG